MNMKEQLVKMLEDGYVFKIEKSIMDAKVIFLNVTKEDYYETCTHANSFKQAVDSVFKTIYKEESNVEKLLDKIDKFTEEQRKELKL